MKTDDLIATDESPDDGAPTRMDSVHRAVFGLVIGTSLAVLSCFAIIWISDDVASIILTTARLLAWPSLVAWAESPDAVVDVPKGLALTVTFGLGLAAAIVFFRVDKIAQRSRMMEPDEQSEESLEKPVGTRSALSRIGTSVTIFGWLLLMFFAFQAVLLFLPLQFVEFPLRILRLVGFVVGVLSGDPVWDRIDSIDNLLSPLVLISALYFYSAAELKRMSKMI